MLMKPEKKNMASLILGAVNPSKDEELKASNEEMAEAPELDPGLAAAADEMMQAMQSNDTASFVEALKSFLEMCKS